MRVNTLRIPCRELVESADFYAKALDLPVAFGTPSEGYVGFQLDNAQILLETQARGDFECGRYLGFSIEVDDVMAFHHACCQRGVTFTHPPEEQAWGGIMTHLEDCNGNTFSVVQYEQLTGPT